MEDGEGEGERGWLEFGFLIYQSGCLIVVILSHLVYLCLYLSTRKGESGGKKGKKERRDATTLRSLLFLSLVSERTDDAGEVLDLDAARDQLLQPIQRTSTNPRRPGHKENKQTREGCS